MMVTQTLNSLLDAVTPGISLAAVRREILAIPGVAQRQVIRIYRRAGAISGSFRPTY